MAPDPSVPLREYAHHILMRGTQDRSWQGQYSAIESGLADYFSCSFLNNPKLGEKAAKVFDPKAPYIRVLANERKFTEFRSVKEYEMPYVGAEIWGGALWAIRDKLGRDVGDSIVATAWLAMAWPNDESQRAGAFVTALLAAAKAKGPSQFAATEAVLRARDFPLSR